MCINYRHNRWFESIIFIWSHSTQCKLQLIESFSMARRFYSFLVLLLVVQIQLTQHFDSLSFNYMRDTRCNFSCSSGWWDLKMKSELVFARRTHNASNIKISMNFALNFHFLSIRGEAKNKPKLIIVVWSRKRAMWDTHKEGEALTCDCGRFTSN